MRHTEELRERERGGCKNRIRIHVHVGSMECVCVCVCVCWERVLTGAIGTSLTLFHVVEHILHCLTVWQATWSEFSVSLLLPLPLLAAMGMQ